MSRNRVTNPSGDIPSQAAAAPPGFVLVPAALSPWGVLPPLWRQLHAWALQCAQAAVWPSRFERLLRPLWN